MATRYQIFKKSSSQNPMNGFENFFYRKIPQSTVYQSCSKNFVPLKNMASRGGHAHFRYMSYIEKLKEFFYSETIGWISTIFGSNTYWVTPHEYCSNQVDICKNMAARVGGAYFPYMSYIEKLKKIKQLFL